MRVGDPADQVVVAHDRSDVWGQCAIAPADRLVDLRAVERLSPFECLTLVVP